MESDGMQEQGYQVFSKRNKLIQFDVLEYDELSPRLRNQIYFIFKDALAIDFADIYSQSEPANSFSYIHDTVCREHGIINLYGYGQYSYAKQCESYLKVGEDIAVLLDLIEISMREIEVLRENFSSDYLRLSEEEAIKELNHRFRENGVGYEFLNGILIRKDSQFLHEETTKPALHLMQEEEFDGALDEFLKAHDHFRKGNHKECIIYTGKAFESTMRTIGEKQAWALTGKENASDLISLLVKNEVIPSYLQTTLQGLATLRNKVAHGQGGKPLPTPEHFVNYALHLCGTNIVMLIEAYRDLPE